MTEPPVVDVPVGAIARGWGLHAIVGAGLAWALVWLGAPLQAAVVAVGAMAVAHEVGDGDFRRAQGGPWNGVADVAWFCVAPLVWWLRSLL